MNIFKKFFKPSFENPNLLNLFKVNEELLFSLFLYTYLQAQSQFKQILAEIFSAFQELPEYSILATFVKEGPLSKSRLGELIAGDHTKILRGPLHDSFERLIKREIIVEVKRNKRGALYNIASRYKPIVEFLVKASPPQQIPRDKS